MSERLVTPETPTSQETPPEESHRGRWLIFLGILVITALAAWYWHDRSEQQAKAAQKPGGGRGSFGDRPVPATVAPAVQGDMPVLVEALGTVTPVYTVTVTSRVQGEILSVHYREGQDVKKGDPLIEIDPRPYQAALTQAEGQLARDKALLEEATIDLKRYQSALARNAIAQQTVADQEQVVHQDEGVVKNDEGLVESAKVNLAYCHIVSPINGRVGLRLVDPGNIVQSTGTTSLVVVTQVTPITVIFSVAEDYLPQIQKQNGHGKKMAVDAYDRNGNLLEHGSLLSLDNQVDTTTGTIKLRAEFANKEKLLFPNQFVNTKLLIDTVKNATLVPTQAIQQSASGPYVYVVTDGVAKMRQIKQGPLNGANTSVTGVNPGEIVVTSGFDKVQEGAKVNAGQGGQNGQQPPQNSKENTQSPATGAKPQQTSQGGSGNSKQ